MELIFATNNAHKLREVREITGTTCTILSLADVNIDVDIPETSDTIEGNAIQKARFIYERTGRACFADDTGLEIAALNGRPGVYSARYAGEGCSFEDNVRKVLQELEGEKDRRAWFRSVFCLVEDGKEYLFEGRVDGIITAEPRGGAGFGYDPVFLPDGCSQTFAEMPAYLKNGISHRGRAAARLLKWLKGRS